MARFTREIAQAGCGQSKILFRIPRDKEADFSLLHRIIAANRTARTNCNAFWRTQS